MTKKTFDGWAKNVGYATIATGALLLAESVVKSVKKAVNNEDECIPEDNADEEITAL